MTNIKIRKNPSTRLIRVMAEGHAGTDVPGKDTVCAAISALMYGYAKEVAMMDDKYLSYRAVEYSMHDGHAHVDTVCKDERTYKRVLNHLAPIERSLEMLAMENPQAVSLHQS